MYFFSNMINVLFKGKFQKVFVSKQHIASVVKMQIKPQQYMLGKTYSIRLILKKIVIH